MTWIHSPEFIDFIHSIFITDLNIFPSFGTVNSPLNLHRFLIVKSLRINTRPFINLILLLLVFLISNIKHVVVWTIRYILSSLSTSFSSDSFASFSVFSSSQKRFKICPFWYRSLPVNTSIIFQTWNHYSLAFIVYRIHLLICSRTALLALLTMYLSFIQFSFMLISLLPAWNFNSLRTRTVNCTSR